MPFHINLIHFARRYFTFGYNCHLFIRSDGVIPLFSTTIFQSRSDSILPLFGTDTTTKTCSTAAGTLLAAVWCHNRLFGSVILPQQKALRHTAVNKIPWKQLVLTAFPVIVKIHGQVMIRK